MPPLESSALFGTNHCRLCWGRFPEEKPDDENTWQTKFRAVFCLDSSSEVVERVILTDRATLPKINEEIDMTLVGLSNLNRVRIRRDNFIHEDNETAFCFHDACFWIFKWQLRKSSLSKTITTLHEFIQSLEPNSPSLLKSGRSWELLDSRSMHNPSILQELVDGFWWPYFHLQNELETCAKELAKKSGLLFLYELPNELRTRVWEYVGLSSLSSFAIVTGNTARLAGCLITPSCDQVSLSPQLAVETISIFGSLYIRSFAKNEPQESNHTTVTGIGFITDLYGINAIKLHGANWNSGWIGKLPKPGNQAWYGSVRATDSSICFTSNSLCYTTISHPSSQVLWDQIAVPNSLSDPNATLFDFDRDINKQTSSTSTHLFRYLSLYKDDEYVKGLTVFVSGNGISGIQAHFTKKSVLSGSRNGCAQYFLLNNDERIIYVWLRIVLSSFAHFAQPSLVIQTTHGRTCSFGSYILPDLVEKDRYRWIRLKSEEVVTGFYHEASTIITRLGVTSGSLVQSVRHSLPLYHDCDFPPIAGPGAGLFVSIAYFGEIKRIEICQIADRCIGMLLYYLNKPPVVLGQWSTLHPSSCVYQSSKANITGICFNTKDFKEHQIVTEIHVLTDEIKIDQGRHSQSFQIGENIAWWFSDLYDCIRPWSGDLREISKKLEWHQKSHGTIERNGA